VAKSIGGLAASAVDERLGRVIKEMGKRAEEIGDSSRPST